MEHNLRERNEDVRRGKDGFLRSDLTNQWTWIRKVAPNVRSCTDLFEWWIAAQRTFWHRACNNMPVQERLQKCHLPTTLITHLYYWSHPHHGLSAWPLWQEHTLNICVLVNIHLWKHYFNTTNTVTKLHKWSQSVWANLGSVIWQ